MKRYATVNVPARCAGIDSSDTVPAYLPGDYRVSGIVIIDPAWLRHSGRGQGVRANLRHEMSRPSDN